MSAPRAASATHIATVAASRSHFARQWDDGGPWLYSQTSNSDDGVPSSAHIATLLPPQPVEPWPGVLAGVRQPAGHKGGRGGVRHGPATLTSAR